MAAVDTGAPARLLSAAAAWERILGELHPEQTWVVTVRDDWDNPREPNQSTESEKS